MSKTGKVKRSKLHEEIVQYAALLAPGPEEQKRFRSIINLVGRACSDIFGSEVKVNPFGSYGSRLATKFSDIDLVIHGLETPDNPGGFSGWKHPRVVGHLSRLEEKLLDIPEFRTAHTELIKHTLVPILKITTEENDKVEISINDERVLAAAKFFHDKVCKYSSLTPLCLVLKAFLKSYKLSEVRDGGLGGYALVNVVTAHIQETDEARKSTDDLGELLISFFERFGRKFNPCKQAVSVYRGGIVSLRCVQHYQQAWKYNRHSKQMRPAASDCFWSPGVRWFVEDPSALGMDVAQGSFNIMFVRKLFSEASTELRRCCMAPQQNSISPLQRLFSLPIMGPLGLFDSNMP